MSGQRNPALWPAVHDGTELREVTAARVLKEQAGQRPDHPAVVVEDAERGATTEWTYAELDAAVDEMARGLIAWGVAKGEHVALMATNCAEWVLLEYALSRIGAVLVTVNPGLRQAEMAHVLGQGRISCFLFRPSFRGHDIGASVRALISDADVSVASPRGFPELRRLAVIGEQQISGVDTLSRVRSLAGQISDEVLRAREAEVDPHDVAQIQFTSGTTGAPKGAMLTHFSTMNNARLMAARAGYREDEVLLSAMPLFHTAGCVCNVLTMLACGGRLVLLDGFEPLRMMRAWDHYRPTVVNAVPTMMTRMFEHPEQGRFRLDGLRHFSSGGTNIPPSLLKSVRDRTGGDPLIVMGMTECSPVITQTIGSDSFESRITTAGIPLPHTEIRIVDPESGEVAPFGTQGELCVRGFQVMAGYFDLPEKTAETIDADGWLHSGDLAVLEETGHLRVTGRLKDMIIRGGENVYPVEIEEGLLDHPSVSQVQVVGVPDADLGEESFAFVVSAPGSPADAKVLRDFCRKRMARHKLPKYIAFVDAMPMTANGKVQKFALREEARRLIESGETSPVTR